MNKPDGFFSYELMIYDDEENVLWEGIVEGQPFKGPGGIPALKIKDNNIPKSLVKVFNESNKSGKLLRSEWSPAWEVIDDESTESETAVGEPSDSGPQND